MQTEEALQVVPPEDLAASPPPARPPRPVAKPGCQLGLPSPSRCRSCCSAVLRLGGSSVPSGFGRRMRWSAGHRRWRCC
ncbi:hypothetical protein [Dankookia sp. P2]|uniref:hypothetical protein n=1 Tax=Dankookia sp. P2 TaxID=3423955 RepID=UPI003D677288